MRPAPSAEISAADAQPDPPDPPTTATPNARGWLLLILLALVWGGSFFFGEIGLTAMGPLTLGALRVGLAAVALFLILLALGRISIRPTAALAWRWSVMGFLNNALPFTLIFWGQTQIEGGLASIFNAMTAVFGVVVAAAFIRSEPLGLRRAIGAGIGVLGVVKIVGLDAMSGFDLRELGQIAILGAALSYAFASVWGRLRLSDTPVEMNALGMLVAASALMIPLALVVEGVPALDFGAGVWAAIIALAIVSTALAYLIYFELIRTAGAANTMLVTLLIPPVAIGLGAAFLGERLDASALIGFGVIAAGLLVIDGRALRAMATVARGRRGD